MTQPTNEEIAVAAYYLWLRRAEEWSWMNDSPEKNWYEAEDTLRRGERE